MTTFFTKVSSLTIALALVAGAFVGVTPAVLAAPATANVTITRPVSIDGTWVTDRHEPAVWGNTVNIDGVLDGVQSASAFHRTEGRKTVLDENVSSIETKLYVDPTWDNTAVRAGVWAVSNGNAAEYGIIEYTTTHGYNAAEPLNKVATFRVWDSNAPGAWTPVAVSASGNVTLRVELSDKWYYYINNTPVGEVAFEAGNNPTAIKEVILNHYNYGIHALEADPTVFGNRAYGASWSDLTATHSFSTLEDALAAADTNDVINVNADLTATAAIIVDKKVTIEGNENTLTLDGAGASGTISGLGLSNDVTVKNLTITGATTDNLVEVTGEATLEDVSVNNGVQAGITLLDGGKLTIKGAIGLSGNKWGGINVKHVPDTTVTFESDADLTFALSADVAFADAAPVWVDSDVLATAGDYVVDNGDALADPVLVGGKVFWFATPEPVDEEPRRRSGSSGQSRRVTTTAPVGEVLGASTGPTTGQVLGASTYNFTVDLSYGSTGADVNALQQMLIDAGLLAIDAPTGWFGPMTRDALAKWQAAHGVAPAVGYFGPITRAAIVAMNAPAATTTTTSTTTSTTTAE